jgi:hypothetical protein
MLLDDLHGFDQFCHIVRGVMQLPHIDYTP